MGDRVFGVEDRGYAVMTDSRPKDIKDSGKDWVLACLTISPIFLAMFFGTIFGFLPRHIYIFVSPVAMLTCFAALYWARDCRTYRAFCTLLPLSFLASTFIFEGMYNWCRWPERLADHASMASSLPAPSNAYRSSHPPM